MLGNFHPAQQRINPFTNKSCGIGLSHSEETDQGVLQEVEARGYLYCLGQCLKMSGQTGW